MSTVAVFGTGALGCLCGARLARAGNDVTLYGTWREALKRIPARGVTLEESGCRDVIAVAARPVPDSSPADLVLVLVKGHATEDIARHAVRAAAGNGVLLTLQNGLGNVAALERAGGRVASGVAFLGATLLGPGHVEDGGGRRVVIGSGPRVETAAALLSGAGFDVEVVDDIEPVVWAKLAVNCAINPLTALRHVRNGALLEQPEAVAVLREAAREVGAVAAARGIALGCDPAELAVEVARRTAGNRSSMLQDLERGARTEIEALNGAVAREGARLGVSTPCNARLAAAVREAERWAP
jgi:2-dehydropantoate 2-reductase